MKRSATKPSALPRWVACWRIPYFTAEILRRLRGIGEDVPLVVAGPRRVMARCELAARYGVEVGITLRQAAYLCPTAHVIPIDEAALHEAADRLLRILVTYTDYVHVEGIAGSDTKSSKKQPQTVDAHESAVFYADLSRMPTEEALHFARTMQTQLEQTVGSKTSGGLAGTVFTAYAAAVTAPLGELVSVPPESAATFLAPLPVTLLPLLPEMARRLKVLGLTTLGSFAALESGAALAQFGKAGQRPYHMARGIDSRRVRYFSRERPLRATLSFETALGARDMLESSLRGAVNRMSAHLRKHGLMGQSLSLTLHLENGSNLTRRSTLREPVSGTSTLMAAVQRLFGQMKIPAAVVCVEILLEGLQPLVAQQLPLLPDDDGSDPALHRALATLLARPNPARCWRVIAARPTARRLEQRYRYEPAEAA